MTANELFLKHVAKHLSQYRANLQGLCKAIEKGQIPAVDDEKIGQHLRLLKQRIGATTCSDEDDFVLRYGLIVPGLFRGINPPIAVLSPERGGFSEPRLRQAVSQVQRLYEALELGRSYFSDLSPHTPTALRQLAERLDDISVSDDNWVTLHADLPDPEAHALTIRAIAILSAARKTNDFGLEILRCLATFRSTGLGDHVAELFKRKLLWPSSLYRDASDDVAEELVKYIENNEDLETLELNHLLLALAWTRGNPALDAFRKWQKSAPVWTKQLHVPPERYLHHAGWALDAMGQRRELISLSCYPIRLLADGAARPEVPCRIEINKRCPACDAPLGWLFDFTHLPDDLFSGDRLGAPRRVLTCSHCACFSTGVFSRYRPDGTADLHPATNSEQDGNFGSCLPSVRELVLSPQSPFATVEPFEIQDATTLGGAPMWLQDAQYPSCPDCQKVMTFLAQFDNGSMPTPEEGIYYSFFCPDCRVAAVNYQQT